MSTLLLRSRYLILVPILGLALAAASFFVFGGIGLIKLRYESLLAMLNPAHRVADMNQGKFIYEVVEYVHIFLIGVFVVEFLLVVSEFNWQDTDSPMIPLRSNYSHKENIRQCLSVSVS
jgi:uncharacterized membrane protein YqhA